MAEKIKMDEPPEIIWVKFGSIEHADITFKTITDWSSANFLCFQEEGDKEQYVQAAWLISILEQCPQCGEAAEIVRAALGRGKDNEIDDQDQTTQNHRF